MNVSEFIFDYYAKKGIDMAFMVTGGQSMWLNDAIGKNGGYQIVCTHHEQSAAMSADAYGRMKNKPALVLVTAGPGSTNAVTGVAGGYTDSSPMIVISGQSALPFVRYQEKTGIRQYGVQGIYIRPLVENVVKYFVTIDDPQKTEYYLEKAYRHAVEGRPGPVWVDVPLDVQNMQVDLRYMEPYLPEKETKKFHTGRQEVRQAWDVLRQAKRPLILAGQGVALSGARELFKKCVEKAGIPVVTARLGIDLMESDHRLYVGRPGNYGERAANFAVQNADVILSVGCRMASSLVGHNPGEFGKHAYIFAVDIDPKELDKPGVKIRHKACMDCLEFLSGLLEQMEDDSLPPYEAWAETCRRWKGTYPVVQPEYKAQNPVNSYYFTDQLSQEAPEHAVVLVDTGSCFHVACQTWKVKKGQKYLTTGGLSSMGYWAAAIGACMANDKKDTIVITGDGSLQMNLQELATIKHNGLPLKIFVFNNDGYLLIRHTQHNFMEDRFIGESPASGVWCPDVVKVAAAYGIKGVRISHAGEARQKIREVLESEGPVVCEVLTPNWQLLAPRISSDKMPDGTLRARDYEDMFPYLPEEELRKNRIAQEDGTKGCKR